MMSILESFPSRPTKSEFPLTAMQALSASNENEPWKASKDSIVDTV